MMIDLAKPAVLGALLAAPSMAASEPLIAADVGYLPPDQADGGGRNRRSRSRGMLTRPRPQPEDGAPAPSDSDSDSDAVGLGIPAAALTAGVESIDGPVAHDAADEMQFQTRTAQQLVESLIMNDDRIEIRGVGTNKDEYGSDHIDACAAYFWNGHALGNLKAKNPTTGGPLYDASNNLIDTGIPLSPDTGVILSSGDPWDFNHNNYDDETTDHGKGGDDDLKATVDASNGWNNEVNDACVLEFEFRCPEQTEAYIPEVNFRYVWGSEEYYEYVNTTFNDVFGFYLNGVNIARLPDTDTDSDVVSINNVNYKNNFKYFHGNDPGTGWEEDPDDVPYDLAVIYPQVEADGFTDTLTAWGEPDKNPSTWNHIKLAVGDVGDGILDSWVLLEGASFTCHDVTVAPSSSQAPSDAPSDAPTLSSAPTPSPTLSPTVSKAPSEAPSLHPTTSSAPTDSPSASPTLSSEPTASPSASPTVSSKPSESPSDSPTLSAEPTASPSDAPTLSAEPTAMPSASPTLSSEPTESPSDSPSVSFSPTTSPSDHPSVSKEPTVSPSMTPSISSKPTGSPSNSPTESTSPTASPSDVPTLSTEPTLSPSASPSESSGPTLEGSMYPSSSKSPSAEPTETHSAAPSYAPSASPTVSSKPTAAPSDTPTLSTAPSDSPSASPTVSAAPTDQPSASPTVSAAPTDSPSASPSESSAPSLRASHAPSTSTAPSDSPTARPSESSRPTSVPSLEPTLSTMPSNSPTSKGSIGPNVVFNDTDADGVQDESEPPLEGIELTLYCLDDNGDPAWIDSVVSDENGQYVFEEIAPALCYIAVSEPQGYVFSPTNPFGNQIYPNGTSPVTEVDYNDNHEGWLVGMHPPLSQVGPNVVFNDLNADGIQDEGEGPLEGVQVGLVCDGEEVGTTTTNAEGIYEFADVLPGECFVFVTPELDGNDYLFSPMETGGNQIFSNGTSPTVSVGYNDTIDTWNVGMYEPLAQIGPSMVFNDADQDGIIDEGEEPLAGVPISLVCDGQVVDVTTSNTEGTYEFKDIQPGDCRVQVTPQPDYTFSPIVTGGNQIDATGSSPTITIGSDETVSSWHVGMFLPPATVGPNEVFDDLNGDGTRDAGEPPLVNQTILLYCYDENDAAQLIATNTTNDQGQYWFNELNPGACFVYVEPQDEYVISPIQEGGNQIDQNGNSPTVIVDWDDVIDDWDVGMYQPVTLGNKVWEDRNADGIQDPDEPGLPGITVTLVNGTGDDIAQIETDADGSYWFTGLPPGEYSVRFELPVDYEFSPAPPPLMMDPDLFGGTLPDMSIDVTPSDDTIQLGNNVGVTSSQTLTSGTNSTLFDAGIYVNVTVEGMAWDDLNANGIMDAGEPPLGGVGVMVSRVEDGLEKYVDYLVTAEDGSYSLQLPPGTYVGLVTAAGDYSLSPKVEGGSDFDPLTLKSDQVLLASGDSGAGSFDAGFFAPGSVSSYVWDDLNANGLQDEGEGGYTDGMIINLYSTDDPTTVIASTSADPSDGSFSFDTVAPGDYEIEFVPAVSGTIFSEPNVGDDDSIDSDVDPATGRAPVTVTSGGTVTDVAAGVTTLPDIGPNTVFKDDNANGIQDEGEPGLQGVTIILYDSNDNEVQTAITDENGSYSLEALQPGDYYISVNNDPSFLFSPVVEGGNQVSANSDAPEYGNSSPVVTLQPGDIDNTLQVGMYETVLLGDKVWNDMNGDGIMDDTEPGIGGIMVTLLLNGEIEDITVTDQDGLYAFENLTPGAYSVKFDLPDPEYVFTINADAAAGTTSHVDRDTGITDVKTLSSGEEDKSFDAGMFLPVTIKGSAWLDPDADGIEDVGEPPMSGVTVTLFNAQGDEVGSQVTGADGLWEFNELPPGTYEALIAPPDHDPEYMLSPSPADEGGTSRTTDFIPETMRTAPVTLLGGEDGDGMFDAGFFVPATIGDYIWRDSNPNGIQEFEEDPYNETVTVKLIDELGYTVQTTESSPTTGFYEFTGVRPGTYDLHFILPNEEYGFTIPHAGNSTEIDSDVSPTTGKATGITVVSGQEKLDVDAGIMDFGPYYPDWTNDVQVCTNDGFDPSWLEIQEENYLYSSKEECCVNHFWWRMTQCMANEQFKFYKNGDICDTKIIFEDWEDNSGPTGLDWTRTTQFDTVEECCANMFWYDFDGCVGRSPVIFKFDFCVDIKGLVDPADCQSADIFANVIGAAVNDGCGQCLDNANTTDIDATTDANVTKIGGVSLTESDGTTVCGGDLAGEDFTNEKTGTTPDIASAADNVATICGTVTVEEEDCTDEACLRDHYNQLISHLEDFVNDGELTQTIRSRSENRLPAVPELLPVEALANTLTTQNLVLPATITGDLDWKYFHGADLTTCEQKVVFTESETPYENLVDCCTTHFQWDVEGCCSKGGGCPELGIVADASPEENPDGAVEYYFPTWQAGNLCDKKSNFESWETTKYNTLAECCDAHFPGGDNADCKGQP